jgi:predicted  nucleic acid-binding Zn-ribbon protein
MHPQLEILLQIQDLRSQRDRLAAPDPGERDLQAQQFNIDVDKAIATLEQKIASMENELEPSVRTRYDRIARGRDRVVSPVINGTCYACFVAISTASNASAEQNRLLRTCENCGRFIYLVQ